MKKSEISLAIMVLKYGLDYLQYLWDPLIAFFMAEFPSQAHFLGLTHVSGQKRAPGHGTPFCALVRAGTGRAELSKSITARGQFTHRIEMQTEGSRRG